MYMPYLFDQFSTDASTSTSDVFFPPPCIGLLYPYHIQGLWQRGFSLGQTCSARRRSQAGQSNQQIPTTCRLHSLLPALAFVDSQNRNRCSIQGKNTLDDARECLPPHLVPNSLSSIRSNAALCGQYPSGQFAHNLLHCHWHIGQPNGWTRAYRRHTCRTWRELWTSSTRSRNQ
jgi:hypothetical protein